MVRSRHQGMPIPPRVHKDLRRANHLSELGDHINSGVIFERLANETYDLGIIRHSPMLFLQASYAFILAGEVDKGVDLAKKGFGILKESNRWQKLLISGSRVIATLSDAGYPNQASHIQTWLDNIMNSHKDAKTSVRKSRGKLPPKCPYCGASILSDEVSWIDNKFAECIYCGSAVSIEK